MKNLFSAFALSLGVVGLVCAQQPAPAAQSPVESSAAPTSAPSITPEQSASEMLSKFDLNHDGILNEPELTQALASLGALSGGSGQSSARPGGGNDASQGQGANGRGGASGQDANGQLAQNDQNPDGQQPGAAGENGQQPGQGQRGNAQGGQRGQRGGQPGQRGQNGAGGQPDELAQNDQNPDSQNPSQPGRGGQQTGQRGGAQRGQAGQRGGNQPGNLAQNDRGSGGQNPDQPSNDGQQPGQRGGGQRGQAGQRGGQGGAQGQGGQSGQGGTQLAQNNAQPGQRAGGGGGGGAVGGGALNHGASASTGGNIASGALDDISRLAGDLSNLDPATSPITGADYAQWADRLRTVEQLIDDPNLRQQVANARAQADDLRRAFNRTSNPPQWGDVNSNVLTPLNQVRIELAKELARRLQPDSLQPADRDPVPPKFAGSVSSYFEALGAAK